MADKDVTADELFKNVSKALGVSEELLRSFAKREHIDPVALYHQTHAAMEWKRGHGHRLATVGRIATVESWGEVQREER